MTNKIRIFVLSLFLIFISNISFSEENYCLDQEGLILPVFDNTECLDSKDLKINQNEFIYLVEIDASERIKKLNDFRKNNKNQLTSSETEKIEDITDEKKKIEIAQTQKEKKLVRQKEIE